MKNIILTLALAAVTCASSCAQEQTAAPAAPAVQAAPVVTALQELDYITDVRPSADAKFYVYLCSASWCPPCRAIMPKVVEQYKDIKAAGGEILLLCFDRTPEAGKAYVKKYGVAFPTVMANFANVGSMGLPGFTPPRGIPNAIFVTPNGNVLSNGHGATLLNWKQIIASKL